MKIHRIPAALLPLIAAILIHCFFHASLFGQTGKKSKKPKPPKMHEMKINEAVMVTVELDYKGTPPRIADALKDIERISKPDDGAGRTFAILDAYGEVTSTGKLHISMHVSSEKTGTGMLKFRRTGEILWQARIKPDPSKPPFSGKDLRILLDNGDGKTYNVDGSKNPPTILDANLYELGKPIREVWADGIEKEMIFIYSACGCPVKAWVKRQGNRLLRTKELPVMFPDDPAALEVINRLMGW